MTINYDQTELDGKKMILGKTKINSHTPLNLLIGFHGAESTPENMLVHGNRLKLTNTILVFPEGFVDNGKGCFSWWEDGPKQKATVDAFLVYSNQLIDQMHAHINNEYSKNKCFTSLWGFSQGASAALVYALLGSYSIHKVASVCGFLPEIPKPKSKKLHNPSVLGIFGINDPVVPPFLAEYALEEMEKKGHETDIHKTLQTHELTIENIQQISKFLDFNKTL